MLEFVVLLLNGILALLWTRAKSMVTGRMQTVGAAALILILMMVSNYLVERLPASLLSRGRTT